MSRYTVDYSDVYNKASNPNTVTRASDDIDRMPEFMKQARAAVVSDVQGQRLATQEFLDQQRTLTLNALRQERIATLAALNDQRLGATSDLRGERQAVMDALHNEEVEAMDSIRGMSEATLKQMENRGRTLIDHAMLMYAMTKQRIEVRRGDFLLLYTGYGDALMRMQKHPDEALLHRTGAALDGRDEKLLDWIETSGIVSVISDNPAVEAFDPELKAAGPHGLLPLHERCLFKLGIHLGELWWLSELAGYLRKTGRHAFLLTAPPLRLPGAVGSPMTPVASV